VNRQKIIKLARDQGCPETATEGVFRVNVDDLGRLLAAEREACAKVCEDIDTEYEGEDVLATWCAAAIRARGE
jgi:hypothetical protein